MHEILEKYEFLSVNKPPMCRLQPGTRLYHSAPRKFTDSEYPNKESNFFSISDIDQQNIVMP